MGPHQHVVRLRGFMKRMFVPPNQRSVERLQQRRNNFRTKAVVRFHALPPANIYKGDRVMVRTGRLMGRVGTIVQEDSDGTRTMVMQLNDSISRSANIEARVPRLLPRPGSDLAAVFPDGVLPHTFPVYLDGRGYDSDPTMPLHVNSHVAPPPLEDLTASASAALAQDVAPCRNPRVVSVRRAMPADAHSRVVYLSSESVCDEQHDSAGTQAPKTNTLAYADDQVNLDIDIPWGLLARSSKPTGEQRQKTHILPYESAKQSRRLGSVAAVIAAERAAATSDVATTEVPLKLGTLLRVDETNIVLVEPCPAAESLWSFDGLTPCEVETRREVVDRRTGRALRFRFSRRTETEIPFPSSVFDRPKDPSSLGGLKPDFLRQMALKAGAAGVSRTCGYTTPAKLINPHYLTEELEMRADMHLPVGFRVPRVNLHKPEPMLKKHALYFKINNFYDPRDRERDCFKVFEW